MKIARTQTAAAALGMFAGAAAAQQQLTTVQIAQGLSRPLFVTSPPGDLSRLFIVEQRGSAGIATRADIRILNLADNTINATLFLTISPVPTGDEQGLLGLAFDPNYSTNGFFYVDYTDSSGNTQVVRYHATGNTASAASATTVLSQAQPFDNHNGGWLAFGPDGFLYIALGDGGAGCDPNTNAQNLNSLLGKLLRINVAALPYTVPASNPFVGMAGMRPEIWAYGLRNPWRNSFDRATGELYIGDVGQSVQEEIDIQPPGAGGRNYGWNCREGLVCSSTAPSNCTLPPLCPACTLANAVNPVWAYPHDPGGNCAVTGGYVYRGRSMPYLRGTYFFADYCSSKIWSFRYTGSAITSVTDRTSELVPAGQQINLVTSFGEDAVGEIYLVSQDTGGIYRVTARCEANCDGSTAAPILNVNDFSCFINSFAAQDPYANCDHSTTVPQMNVLDFACFINKFAAGCS